MAAEKQDSSQASPQVLVQGLQGAYIINERLACCFGAFFRSLLNCKSENRARPSESDGW
jgi:hypothetical protein